MERLNFYAASPKAIKAWTALETFLAESSIDKPLAELVRLRAMHTADARKGGETERRLYAVSVWRDTPFFTARERAALAWTERMTTVAQQHPSDADYAELAAHFNPQEMVELTMLISTISGWNRFAIGFGKMPAL
jgi:alkylhydroperoxidase family enzyme